MSVAGGEFFLVRERLLLSNPELRVVLLLDSAHQRLDARLGARMFGR